jgi:hypothetical protein
MYGLRLTLDEEKGKNDGTAQDQVDIPKEPSHY